MGETNKNKQPKTSKLYKKYARVRRKILSSHLNQVRLFLLIVMLAFTFTPFWVGGKLVSSTGIGNTLEIANSFLFLPEGKVYSFENKTNILILGKSGTGEDSPEITDTIMVASINHVNPTIGLVSIPRDIWSPEISDKINAAYKKGNEIESGGGMKLAKSFVQEIVGQPIHYVLVFDYASFTEVIDILGGVDVRVERSFADSRFPIPGRENDDCGEVATVAQEPEYSCRYETVTFSEGMETMDGVRALKFSRSRQSADIEEGTDLARAARQQAVLTAIRHKLLSFDTLASPSKMNDLLEVAKSNIETDISNVEAAFLARKMIQARDDINRGVIPEELLNNPSLTAEFDFLYVFVPPEGDWSPVHRWVEDIFSR